MPLEGSGAQTAVIGTEHTLFSSVAYKTYVGFVRLTNMQVGDTVIVKVYTKILAGDPLEVIYSQTYVDVQDANGGFLQVTIPVPSDQQWQMTLQQTSGVGRVFSWKVNSI